MTPQRREEALRRFVAIMRKEREAARKVLNLLPRPPNRLAVREARS